MIQVSSTCKSAIHSSHDLLQDSLGLNGNKCRNPDGDVRGPWCFVNAMSGHMAYCDVPSCGGRFIVFPIINIKSIISQPAMRNSSNVETICALLLNWRVMASMTVGTARMNCSVVTIILYSQL
ncbi:hypothetical protein CAPTEDRAFT_92113 [Capitella teleta]|uniref:Kringle domain-containing protein n=1 Tax=Capitella teleta TaxID=283909 RepID=R7TWV8_CAPTE|nr:hypothetical protein CAPTEDRAFT_92113 [Capitella teleta]|eukprot:ELT95916.1 hypothetical protein CAPTEDRAFT_92113 [Capitella teleta]